MLIGSRGWRAIVPIVVPIPQQLHLQEIRGSAPEVTASAIPCRHRNPRSVKNDHPPPKIEFAANRATLEEGHREGKFRGFSRGAPEPIAIGKKYALTY
jgi:hypothetical protein